MRTISFHTIGCRLNQSETAVIKNSFFDKGFKEVFPDKPADIAIINTCTVTAHGDADTRRLISRILRTNPETRIALIGCQAQVQQELLKGLPNVHWIVGNEIKLDIVDIIKKVYRKKGPQVLVPPIKKDDFTINYSGIDKSHIRANLKIQDGCDFFCSYCEIPYARGRSRSRKFNDIMLEAARLIDAGYKEIVLTGINVGKYSCQNKHINEVVKKLIELQELKRLRISSIEPTTIDENLIHLMAKKKKLCRYLHIPLQSGSDRILKSMRRRYTSREFSQFISMAHKKVPDICIGTDVMVGFPGEREEDFQSSYNFLQQAPVSYFHVFSYSLRHKAKSRLLSNPVDQKDIIRRSKLLRELSTQKRRIYHQTLMDKTVDVLFEQKKEGVWSGLTDNYVRVYAKSRKNLANIIMPVQLKKVTDKGASGIVAR